MKISLPIGAPNLCIKPELSRTRFNISILTNELLANNVVSETQNAIPDQVQSQVWTFFY